MAEKWTPDDERDFERMSKRREAVLGERRRVLLDAVIETRNRVVVAARPPAPQPPGASTWAAPAPVEDRVAEAIVDGLIANADAIRDALAPYDSGIRVKDEEPGRKRVTIRPQTSGLGYWIDEGEEWKGSVAHAFDAAEAAVTHCKSHGWLWEWDDKIPLFMRPLP